MHLVIAVNFLQSLNSEILAKEFSTTFNFQKFKVALIPLRIFFKLCGKFSRGMLVFPTINNGVADFVFELYVII